jgi:hypothetical protein
VLPEPPVVVSGESSTGSIFIEKTPVSLCNTDPEGGLPPTGWVTTAKENSEVATKSEFKLGPGNRVPVQIPNASQVKRLSSGTIMGSPFGFTMEGNLPILPAPLTT